ncbi:hypothetical protein K6U06_24240 [Acidiferrimicrobium sp. IK]|uniref:hypothetical protein n=1 Tax=Acidiferrimicrobium sp. IK TaxID=2871700 RepID=UPI0021CAFAE3|nr:hypothetical protein [Acidiferrimicrobium sp. IK]MCU4187489.1 hypothetical protein [Acidiferrimicrobium sp. IK]
MMTTAPSSPYPLTARNGRDPDEQSERVEPDDQRTEAVHGWDVADRWADIGQQGTPPAAAALEEGRDPEPGASAKTGGRRRLRRLRPRLRRPPLRRPRLRSVVVCAVVVTLAAATGVLGWKDYRSSQLDQARKTATRAASSAAVTMADYSYSDLPKNFKAVEAASTPAFASQFAKSSAALEPILTKYKASSTAKLIASGVSNATENRVVVLVYLDQTVRNSTTKSPTTERNRLVLTMLRRHGRWLVDQLSLE